MPDYFQIVLIIVIIICLIALFYPVKIRPCPEKDTCTMAKRVGGFPNCREFWGRKCTTYYPEEFFK